MSDKTTEMSSGASADERPPCQGCVELAERVARLERMVPCGMCGGAGALLTDGENGGPLWTDIRVFRDLPKRVPCGYCNGTGRVDPEEG